MPRYIAFDAMSRMDAGIRSIAGVFGTTIKHQKAMECSEKLHVFRCFFDQH